MTALSATDFSTVLSHCGIDLAAHQGDDITVRSPIDGATSSRPLVISSDSSIRLKFLRTNIDYEVSCDSQIMLPIQDGEEVIVKRSNKNLNLVHPQDYNYFNTLSSKLGWAKKTF